MNTDFSSIETILLDLRHKINQVGLIEPLSDDLAKTDFIKKKEAYCWIHATDDYSELLSQESYNKNLPSLFHENALKYYDKWFPSANDLKIRRNIIEYPNPKDKIIDYFAKLSAKSLSKDKQNKWWESLNSFVHFLRKSLNFDDRGYLNSIFPEKMEVRHKRVIRIIPKTLYPIDIFAVSEIIQALIDKVLNGRSNSRRSAAEALGFTWLCLAFSWLYVPTYEENLHQISTEDLFRSELEIGINKEYVNILTLFGDVKIPVSKELYEYLLALAIAHEPANKLVFKQSMFSLRRSFDSVLQSIPSISKLGKITFLTLTHPPHEVIGRRYQG